MDFTVSAEHDELRRTLRGFFEKEAPTHVVAELDRAERFPAELYAKMADLGLCGVTIEEAYGGSAADGISLCIVGEEMARAAGCLVYAHAPTVGFCAPGIQQYGTEEQKRRFLPEIAAGRLRFAMGLSEPDAGSDLTHLSTRATRDGDDFVVQGQKIFTTGADTAEYLFAFVRTNPDAPARYGLSVLVIPRDAPGVTVRTLRKLAGQATHTCEVFLDDVRVPADALVGDEGNGVSMIFDLLDAERIMIGANGVGIAQGALDLALRHAHDREQFGSPIANFQAVGHPLADMAMQVEAARLMVWRAAWRKDRGERCTVDASMAKVLGSELATRCAAAGMQILGGYSYMVEYGMERYYRESKLTEIVAGTNQIQRNVILRELRAGL
ncbi:MAG TPA: acyl-CoA dehydrogenase family protein [Acidimicrobiales bacterium]|nr:acyl-CoA dehydrogenase family protein [Acidimicrobiales bacterium]